MQWYCFFSGFALWLAFIRGERNDSITEDTLTPCPLTIYGVALSTIKNRASKLGLRKMLYLK